MSILKSNERSEAIELIKESQSIFNSLDLIFKQASGEQSLKKTYSSDKRANTLFPDVLFYADEFQLQVALGWELKMPDTDINDIELLSNAKDKADRLKTDMFVLWNFKDVRVYRRDNEDWEISKTWDTLPNIKNRDDVVNNRLEWKQLLKEVIIHLNKLFKDEVVSSTSVVLSTENIAMDISEKYSDELANFYKTNGDRIFEIEINRWFKEELLEFSDKKADNSYDYKAKMYAKNVLLNWINRITFSNVIKDEHNSVDKALSILLDDSSDFKNISESFNEATKVSDFYTILYCDKYDSVISDICGNVIKEYALFLNEIGFENLSQNEFQRTLEGIITISKRELMGLYTTPKKLAELLVKSTVENLNGVIIDPCVGSGTIASTALELVKNKMGLELAHQNVWGSDKYRMPLQVANISMSSRDSLNQPNIIFQRDLLSLKSGDFVTITNPENGEEIKKEIPEFDYVISNLPFIRSERIDDNEEKKMIEINQYLEEKGIDSIDLKKDWYHFGIIGIEKILSNGGKAAVITSNSWLKTKNKKNYIETLFKLFNVEKVIISGEGRWFDNADVVTTILVLKKEKLDYQTVDFIKINKNINKLSPKELEEISDNLLINCIDEEDYTIRTYSHSEIIEHINYGMSLNVLFSNMEWFDKIKNVTIPMKQVFYGRRGVKSTNDNFFYDIPEEEGIEDEYIKPVLKSPTSITNYYAEEDSNAFVVNEEISTLEEQQKLGALKYIKKFEQSKTKSQLTLERWYQYPESIHGDFVTSLNPDRRLFWSYVPNDLLINQRLTVFKMKEEVNVDKRLIHALLNTFLGQLMIEATGFGRGLGVLDTTKDGILDSEMFNFELLEEEDIKDIIIRWELISKNVVLDALNQLDNEEWVEYNKFIFEKFNVLDELEGLMDCLRETIIMRLNVRK